MSVSVSDIETALGRTLTSLEVDQANQRIGDALMQIRVRLGDLALLDQEVVDYVAREAVVARFRNPDGYQYEAIDDYRYGLPPESRQVTITDEWWNMLSPTPTAYSVKVSSPLDRL